MLNEAAPLPSPLLAGELDAVLAQQPAPERLGRLQRIRHGALSALVHAAVPVEHAGGDVAGTLCLLGGHAAVAVVGEQHHGGFGGFAVVIVGQRIVEGVAERADITGQRVDGHLDPAGNGLVCRPPRGGLPLGLLHRVAEPSQLDGVGHDRIPRLIESIVPSLASAIQSHGPSPP
ncbi:hypothetical protein D9M70_321430 [compost metagenome]